MEWLEILEQIYEKELSVAARNAHKIPYTAQDGVFDDWSEKNICWWTNGFWAGLLWQLHGFRQNALFAEVSQEIEKKLDANFLSADGMDHDSGFKWLLTAGANYRLTGSEASKNRLLLAANDLAGRFNPSGNFIRAWNDGTGQNAGWAIIDCMMNLPLLYLAEELTHDPRFGEIAVRHAHTAQKYFVREDGSCLHIAVFDPRTGAFLEERGGQGMAAGSMWTRGQAWALYGFTLSYLHTERGEFLQTACRVAENFCAHIPASGRIPTDFCQPAECPFEDSSAAAVAACGLLELARASGNAAYRHTAEKLLNTLAGQRCDLTAERDNILTHCTAAYHDASHNFPLIYGDYFFTEAILKLTDKETFLW